MAFWGVTDDRQGHGVIIETPDDAAIHLMRLVSCNILYFAY
jgi:hypothetical protein